MILATGKYYLYRHIDSSSGLPFYIGVGTKGKRNVRRTSTEYSRAYEKRGRNELWHQKSNNGYQVEIMMESNEKSFIELKEQEFITLYGRIDIGTGILTNMTDGGDYYPTGSTENALKSLESAKRNGTHERRVKILYEASKNRRQTFKTVYIYDKNGCFIKKCSSLIECAKYIGAPKTYVSICISQNATCKGYIVSFISPEFSDSISNLIRVRKPRTQKVAKLNPHTNEVIITYNSLAEAAYENRISSKGNILTSIKKGQKCVGFKWKYIYE